MRCGGVRHGLVWPGTARSGVAWHRAKLGQRNRFRPVAQLLVNQDLIWHVWAGHGAVRHGMARPGWVRSGVAWPGKARLGYRHSFQGLVGRCVVWRGGVWWGAVWRGFAWCFPPLCSTIIPHGRAWYGPVGPGVALRGMAWNQNYTRSLCARPLITSRVTRTPSAPMMHPTRTIGPR